MNKQSKKTPPAPVSTSTSARGELITLFPKKYLGKVSHILEIREEFAYFLVHALFCPESVYFQLFIGERFICELFLEKFYKLDNYTYFQENFPLGKLSIHSLQHSSVTRKIYFLKTLPSNEKPGKDSFEKHLQEIKNSSWEKSMKFFNYSLSRADSLRKFVL